MTWFTNLVGLSDDIPYFFWKTEELKKKRQGRTASIKGHDTDRWGRNWVTSELNSDFEPGSSWRRHKTPYEVRQEKTEEQNIEYLSASTQVGSALHSLVEKQMLLSGRAKAVEVPVFDKETGNSGFVDIIGAEGQPIDIKTLDPTGWGKLLRTGKASPEHWAQLQGYLQALDKESGELIYMPRDDPENRIVINVKRDRIFGKYGIEPVGEEEQSFRQSRAQEVYRNSEETLRQRYQAKLEWTKELEVQRSNNLKGHDAGRWGREWVTTAVGSDFSPGSSVVGNWVTSHAERLFGQITQSIRGRTKTGRFIEAMNAAEETVVTRIVSPMDVPLSIRGETTLWGPKTRAEEIIDTKLGSLVRQVEGTAGSTQEARKFLQTGSAQEIQHAAARHFEKMGGRYQETEKSAFHPRVTIEEGAINIVPVIEHEREVMWATTPDALRTKVHELTESEQFFQALLGREKSNLYSMSDPRGKQEILRDKFGSGSIIKSLFSSSTIDAIQYGIKERSFTRGYAYIKGIAFRNRLGSALDKVGGARTGSHMSEAPLYTESLIAIKTDTLHELGMFRRAEKTRALMVHQGHPEELTHYLNRTPQIFEETKGWSSVFDGTSIKGHDANRWGRDWVTKAVDSDFKPGLSYLCPVGKTFVGLLGTKFENIIKSPVFQKALETGRPLEKLGEGGFGEVWKMETTFGGEKFNYIKKIQKGNVLNRLDETEIGGMLYEHKVMEDIRLAEGGRARDIPHSYGANKEGTVLYQEYLHGKVAGVETTEKQGLGFLGIIKRLAKKGFSHNDISPTNLFILETGQPMFVDVGLASRLVEKGKEQFVTDVLSDVESLNSVVQSSMKFQAFQTGKFNTRISAIESRSQEIITKAISEDARQIQQMSHDAVCVQNLRDMNPKRIKR